MWLLLPLTFTLAASASNYGPILTSRPPPLSSSYASQLPPLPPVESPDFNNGPFDGLPQPQSANPSNSVNSVFPGQQSTSFANLVSQPQPNGFVNSQTQRQQINPNGNVNLVFPVPSGNSGQTNPPAQPQPFNPQLDFVNSGPQPQTSNTGGDVNLVFPVPPGSSGLSNLPNPPQTFNPQLDFVNSVPQPQPINPGGNVNLVFPVQQGNGSFPGLPAQPQPFNPQIDFVNAQPGNINPPNGGLINSLPGNVNLPNGGFVNPAPQLNGGFVNPQDQSQRVSPDFVFPDTRPPVNGGLEVAFQWRYLDWVHPTVRLTGKNFTLGNPLTQDVDIDRKGRVFVTSPQWLEGTPITLSVITNLKGRGGPLLTPYPDWTWHKNDCNSLVSVFRIAIDDCNRLWLVDTGTAAGRPVCPVKLMAFDLNTDQPLLRYTIPAEQTVGRRAQYVNPVVEVGETCRDSYVYVADVLGHGLLVYSLRENRSWRLNNTATNAFGSDIEATRLTINGESTTLDDGTLGLSLSPRGFFNKRYLYFNSLASFRQKFADVDSLKRSFLYEPVMYESIAKRASQAGVQATSRTGATFFQLAELNGLACWNIERPFVPGNIVLLARDPVNIQYVSGIKVLVNARGEEEVWFNTNRLLKTITMTRRLDELNFRLIRGKVDQLIRGTRCEPTGRRGLEPDLNGWRRI